MGFMGAELMFLYVNSLCAQLSLTAARILLHSVPQRSCSAQSPCVTLPLPASTPSSLAPGRPLVL